MQDQIKKLPIIGAGHLLLKRSVLAVRMVACALASPALFARQILLRNDGKMMWGQAAQLKKLAAIAGAYAVSLSAASGQIQIQPLLNDLAGRFGPPKIATLSLDGKTLAFNWCGEKFTECGIYTRPLAGGPAKLLTNRWGGDPRWSPDGTMIAFTEGRNRFDVGLIVRSLASGVERELGAVCYFAYGSSPAPQPSWSPDSRWIAASLNTGDMGCAPALFPVAEGPPVRILAESGGSPVFSPEGHLLAYTEGQGVSFKSLKLLHLDAGYRAVGPAVSLAQEPRPIVRINWTSDGKSIVYEAMGDGPYLRRIGLEPGARPQAVPGLPGRLSISSILEFTAAGALADVTQPVDWERADLQAVKIEKVPEPACSVGVAACSPDGRQRVFISTRTGLSEIHIANADSTNDRVLVKPRPEPADGRWGVDEVPHLAGWSPDGKWIAVIVEPLFGDHGSDYRDLYLVPASGGQPRRVLEHIFEFAWSHDSQSVVVSRDERYWPGEAILVRVDISDRKITQLAMNGNFFSLKVSPDGQWLYFRRLGARKSMLARMPVTGGAVEFLAEAPEFLVGEKYLYFFQDARILRMDPQTRQTSDIGEAPKFSSTWLSPDERYIYFKPPSEFESHFELYSQLSLALIQGL
jgi:Tol biopolymer transport system component